MMPPPVVGLPVGLLKAVTIIAIKKPGGYEVNEINKSFLRFIVSLYQITNVLSPLHRRLDFVIFTSILTTLLFCFCPTAGFQQFFPVNHFGPDKFIFKIGVNGAGGFRRFSLFLIVQARVSSSPVVKKLINPSIPYAFLSVH